MTDNARPKQARIRRASASVAVTKMACVVQVAITQAVSAAGFRAVLVRWPYKMQNSRTRIRVSILRLVRAGTILQILRLTTTYGFPFFRDPPFL